LKSYKSNSSNSISFHHDGSFHFLIVNPNTFVYFSSGTSFFSFSFLILMLDFIYELDTCIGPPCPFVMIFPSSVLAILLKLIFSSPATSYTDFPRNCSSSDKCFLFRDPPPVMINDLEDSLLFTINSSIEASS